MTDELCGFHTGGTNRIYANGQLKEGAVEVVQDKFDLGYGHSMAIYALLKGMKNESSK